MMIGCAVSTGLSGVTNVFALLRLLPVRDRDKGWRTWALRRHQIMVLERQLGKGRPRFSLADRAFLAAGTRSWSGGCRPATASCLTAP
jgi:hypothetical protein